MTASARPHPAVPPQLAHLPVCPRRGLPVPYVNQRDDGPPAFSTIFGERVLACARDRLCGVGAQPLTSWVAFLGGRRSAQERAFLDPPMHPPCAEAAARLCPYVVRAGTPQAMKRRRSVL